MAQNSDNIRVVPLWPTNIFVSKIEIDTKDIIEEIYNLKNTSTSLTLTKSNYGGWQSCTDLYKNTKFNNLIFKIKNYCKWIFNFEKVSIKQMWACINNKGDMNLIHSHGNQYHISGIYYLKVPKKSGNIVFRDPRPVATNSILYSREEIETFFPEDNLLLLFPSFLDHYVLPNESNDDRICISFDINFEDKNEFS